MATKQLLDAQLVFDALRTMTLTAENDRDLAAKNGHFEKAAKHEIESKNITRVLSRLESGDFHVNQKQQG